jgi:hypothetical protein
MISGVKYKRAGAGAKGVLVLEVGKKKAVG